MSVPRITSVYNSKVPLGTRRAVQASLVTGVIVGIIGDFFVRPRAERFIDRHGIRAR